MFYRDFLPVYDPLTGIIDTIKNYEIAYFVSNFHL